MMTTSTRTSPIFYVGNTLSHFRWLKKMHELWIPAVTLVIFQGLNFPVSLSANTPCAARQGDPGQGQICVCNSTYCDTIERPERLPRGQYHQYCTSNSTPGFTHTTGVFNLGSVTFYDDDIVFTINNTVRYQTIRGFGGSFTDSAGFVISTLPPDAQDQLIKSYFGESGIEYTLFRTPIGGSDFSLRLYTLDDVPNDVDLKHFDLTNEDYFYKIPFIKKAKAASSRGFTIYGCSFNAPDWMKSSHTRENLAGYIRSDLLNTWAAYHVKFLEAYKQNGIDIWAVSGGNEVFFPLMIGFSLNNTLSFAQQQRIWVKEHLVPQLRAANLSEVKFLALDDMRLFALYWMERFADDPEAYKLVDGVALHWYMDFWSPPSILDALHHGYPDKEILYTESSVNIIFGGNTVELGSWSRAALYINNIMENLSHWTTGYIDWNLALNTDGGPTMSFGLDAAIIINSTSGEFYKQPMFYGLGHFSKFIPPGSRRVEVTSNLNATSFLSANDNFPKDFKFSGSIKTSVPFPIPPINIPSEVFCFATANSDESYTAIVFSNKNTTSRVRIEVPEVGRISVDIDPFSINTFVYWL